MEDDIDKASHNPKSLLDVFNRYRGDNLLLDLYWFGKYSADEIIDSVDEIALAEIGKIVIRNAARYAYGERCRRTSDAWDRRVPDELMEKLERDLKRTYEHFQQAKLKKAQIDRVEALTGRANTIQFPKKERLPRARLKKESIA